MERFLYSFGAVFGGIGATVIGMAKQILTIHMVTQQDIINAILLALIGGSAGWFAQRILEVFLKTKLDYLFQKIKSIKTLNKKK